MKIGILKAGHVPRRVADRHPDYDVMFERLLAGRGLTFQSFDVEHGAFPASVTEADGWLITGSACGAYEDHAWIPPLEDFIREARAKSVRMIGICFGHQVLAQAMGARVEKFAGGRSMGAVNYECCGTGEALTVLAFHGDQVMTVPQGAALTVSGSFCRIAGLAYEDDVGAPWAISLQPHPEFDVAYEADLIEAYSDGLPAEAVDAAKASLGAPLSNEIVADRMAAFFKSGSADGA
ncbi:MAG: type 1 glutamine amidotransferase [Candidatus Phaeomarinobacter sp.]